MTYNFDEIIERRGTDSAKWCHYGDDVLPMWVADMDFRTPEPILRALHERIDHGIFGYCRTPEALRGAICDRMDRLYDWEVTPEQISFLPGLVSGLNVVCKAIGAPGAGVLVNAPVYPPFLNAPDNQARALQIAQLATHTVQHDDRTHLRYELDFDAFAEAITDQTQLYILCNPHNPVGRAFTRDELLRIAEICAQHDLVICADEIHSDLLMGDTQHVPLASLAPEIAQRTITFQAPSKTFNMPGLGCSFAIIQNPELRKRMDAAANRLVPHVNVLGYTAALAAYTECDDWVRALCAYLTTNREVVLDYVNEHLPSVRVTQPEATYLAWLDCRETGIADNPFQFFLEEAKVALNDGARFGPGGEGFVRLNYGCPRELLIEGLTRIHTALDTVERATV